MQYRYSIHALDVMRHRDIREEWVEEVLNNPSRIESVCDEEIRYFGTVTAFKGRCLKVVVNPKKKLIVTVYFDRKMRKRGCR
jgi:hypothetical protein